MPEQNEKKLPKAPAFNPKVKETIAAFKENNNPKNLNVVINELVRSPLLAPAVFDLQGQPAPKPEADGRVQLPKETKISLVMVTSPEGKRYYLGFSDWDAVHEWQKAQPKAAQQIILLRFDDYANMIAKNTESASGAPSDRVRQKDEGRGFPEDRSTAGRAAGSPHPSRRQGHAGRAQHSARRHDRPGLRGAGRRPRCGLCLSVRYDRKR